MKLVIHVTNSVVAAARQAKMVASSVLETLTAWFITISNMEIAPAKVATTTTLPQTIASSAIRCARSASVLPTPNA